MVDAFVFRLVPTLWFRHSGVGMKKNKETGIAGNTGTAFAKIHVPVETAGLSRSEMTIGNY